LGGCWQSISQLFACHVNLLNPPRELVHVVVHHRTPIARASGEPTAHAARSRFAA
jgi:hypothetical protein